MHLGGRKPVFLQLFKSTRGSREYYQRLFLTTSHLLTYCTKKKLQIISLFPLLTIFSLLLLGNNKAHLYKVENSPGSSFCSVIFHTAGNRCCSFPICQLFPLLQLVPCPSPAIRLLNHSHHMLILILNYLKSKKKSQ